MGQEQNLKKFIFEEGNKNRYWLALIPYFATIEGARKSKEGFDAVASEIKETTKHPEKAFFYLLLILLTRDFFRKQKNKK